MPLGIATATLSPVASYEIGQYFKGNDTEGGAAQILAHTTLLGAAVAAAGGNNALTAGLSAGAAEAAAPKLAQYLYGKDTKDLTAEEKSTISAITGLVASGVGATTGDVASTVQSGQVGQNAVENNALLGDDIRKKAKDFFSDLSSKVKHPLDQGVINGVATVADGLLVIADAFGDTAVSAIHCPLGTSACADAMENNRKKGEAIYKFLINLDLKEQANKIKQSYADLNRGDPEKVANAQRVQAEVFTSLGLSAMSIKKLGTNSVPNIPKLDWSTGWATRGLQWEATLKKLLPPDFIDLNSFKTFDFYNPSTQTAISAKSMDTIKSFNGTNGLKSLEQQMRGYIDDTLTFKQEISKKHKFELSKDMITKREVQIAIPEGTSKAKMQVINNMVDYGKKNNVKVVVTVTKSGK